MDQDVFHFLDWEAGPKMVTYIGYQEDTGQKNLQRNWHTSRMKRIIYAPCPEDELTAFICGLIFGYLFRGRF